MKYFLTKATLAVWLLMLHSLVFADDFGNIPPDIPSGFNYQGQVLINGSPANGSFDVDFLLYDSLDNTTNPPIAADGQTLTIDNGLMNTVVDFGVGVFGGQRLWLEVNLYDPDTGEVSRLVPRISINSSPYALMADQVRLEGITSQSIAAQSVRNYHILDQSIRLSKLATTGAQVGDVIQFDGSSWQSVPINSSPWAANANGIHFNAGRIGIGTSSPSVKLHLHGDETDEFRISGTNSVPALHFRRNSNGADWYLKIDPESNQFSFQAENDSVEKIMTIKPSGEITRKKQTKTIYLGFEAFVPSSSVYSYQTTNFLGMIGLKSTFTGAGAANFHASLDIPADATITDFALMAGDNSPTGAVVGRLGFRGFGATNGGLALATLTSTNSPYGAIHNQGLDHAVGDNRSYYIQVDLDTVNSASQAVIFGGVRITYETTAL